MSIVVPSRAPLGLSRSYSYCEALTRRAASHFYPAFQVLPRGQRRAMCALYAFLRIADDLADAPAELEDRRAALVDFRRLFDLALAGCYEHPLAPALYHTVRSYGVPRKYLEAALDGVEMDLGPLRIDTFDDLYRYCYRVASAVGLACIHIWGFRGDRACEFAEKAGIAFQLTNILRDLSEDAGNQRIYLPSEDLARFGYGPDQLGRGERDQRFEELMRFQVARARSYYEQAEPLVPLLSSEGRAVYLVMARTYRGLLDAIEARGYDVFTARVRLGRWQKIGFLLRSLPVRWGWA